MKRALLFIFMTVCVLGMSACSSKDAMPETSDSASNPVQNTDISNLNGGKIWSEQDIVSMFSGPVGQVVKTPPFHGGNMGSNPVRVIIFVCKMRTT